MQNYFIIRENKVVNKIVADETFLETHYYPELCQDYVLEAEELRVDGTMPDIGWSFIDGSFIPPISEEGS